MRASTGDAGRVAILLATYNGEQFLDEQMRSLAGQDFPDIDILASDDGSTDRTLALLHDWQRVWDKGSFSIISGAGKGFAENFRSLLTAAEAADFVAFCDQDDIWDRDKLSAAVATLAARPAEVPGLYCSRTRLIDIAGNDIGFSPLFARPPGFRNAIVQNVGGGNTMVLNRAAFELVAESARRTGFISHDWWCYLMVSGAGGEVHYDSRPRIGYRQHSGNLVGSNIGFEARMRRTSHILAGRFARMNDANIAALDQCADLLSADSRKVLAQFKAVRRSSPPAALWKLAASGIYRQTLPGTIALFVATLLRKL